MQLNYPYDELEEHAPAFARLKPERPFSEDELNQLLGLVREIQKHRLELKRMKGGRKAKQHQKALGDLEKLVMQEMSARGYLECDWPQHRLAVRIETSLERGFAWEDRPMGLVIFFDNSDTYKAL